MLSPIRHRVDAFGRLWNRGNKGKRDCEVDSWEFRL